MKCAIFLFTLCSLCLAQPQNQFQIPNQEGDWIAHDFGFKSGEKLSELRLHYTTLAHPNGTPRDM
ncbi:MAG: hypothetical protein WDO73_11270 [Ignavibacteriota bacterium]